MGHDNTEPQDVDLERTDRLPVLNLNPALIDADVADDAVRLDMSSVVPRIKNEFQRAPKADASTLAASMRAAEERISRQRADFDALSVSHAKTRAAEQAAIVRVNALAAEQATLRSLLENEKARAHQLDRGLGAKTADLDNLRVRLEDALLEVDRHRLEARTLRDTLVARDATIVQVLYSMGERDEQLTALQREHARLVPLLDERSRTGAALESDLRDAMTRAEAAESGLRSTQVSVTTLTERIKSNEAELAAVRRELNNAKLLAATHQERLRTREWREGFDQNLVGNLDAKLNAAQVDRGVLKTACDQLRQRVAELEASLASRDEMIAKLEAALLEDRAQRALTEAKNATEAETARGELMQKMGALQADLQARDEKVGVDSEHLLEELVGKSDELAAKGKALDQLKEENRNLNSALERTRAALEEREFLIRRLERSESNNLSALGRIQTSIESIGAATLAPASAPPPVECSAEMVRLDGEEQRTHVLGRRTRIGRAPGCEIQVDSSSVSRHHALILVGMREVIVEDLNSTNGVLVNGRKVARQLLSDGDQLTIGEAQFKLNLKLEQRSLESQALPSDTYRDPAAPDTP